MPWVTLIGNVCVHLDDDAEGALWDRKLGPKKFTDFTAWDRKDFQAKYLAVAQIVDRPGGGLKRVASIVDSNLVG